MIVLHAGYCEGSLYLWGEATDKVRRTTRQTSPKPHPAGASLKHLGDALKEIPIKRKSGKNRAVAWLPTLDAQGPLLSREASDSPQAIPDTIKPWAVPAYWLSAQKAVEILSEIAGKRSTKSGAAIGADLGYWTKVLYFAGSLVVRQQFLPDLVTKDGISMAVWNPVIVNEDIGRLAVLAGGMPPVARALTPSETRYPSMPADSILRAVTSLLVDQLVRSSIGEHTRTSATGKRSSRVHDSWLNALATNGRLKANPVDAARLESGIRQWQRPIRILSESPFNLCFRLEEPEAADPDKWQIRYLLQSHSDPSLLVAIEDVWNNEPGQVLGPGGGSAREFMLFALGQAAGACLAVSTGLEKGDIYGCKLDANGAYNFLVNDAAALRQAGYAIMLPAWWTGGGTKARLSAQASVGGFRATSGILSLDSIVSFEWEMALGDQKMSIEELEELVRLKVPLVRVRGQWVSINDKHIQSAISFLKKGTREIAFRDVIRTTRTADVPEGLDFGGVRATGRIADTLQRLDGKVGFEEIRQPEEFQGTLRPYQLRGYSWLVFLRQWGLGGCLADDMGLGKTIQILALVQHDWPAHKRPVLLICPTSVMNNWRKEAARFTPDIPVLIHHGTDRERREEFKRIIGQYAIVVSSYGLLQRDVGFLAEVPWRGIVLDEAQNIKNNKTKKYRAARMLEGDYRFALTGTPVENNVGELWSIMEFLNPGFLGTAAQFKRRFFTPIQANKDREAAELLKRATGPFILRRLKTDKAIIADLPEKIETKVGCPLTKEQVSLYASVLRDAEGAMYAAEGIKRKGVILSTLSKLKQVCNHPAHLLGDNSKVAGRSGKVTRLTEMLEEVLEAGRRALIFTQFVEMGSMLQGHLQESFGQEVLFLHGGVPRGRRDEMVERFQGGGAQIFILSLRAGGTGLNLTAATYVFHFDRWWNPAVENQATDRAFRIGQEQKVQVYKFVCDGTMEEKIDELIESKKVMAENVIGSGEGWLTEMSNDDLREVLALSSGAVGV